MENIKMPEYIKTPLESLVWWELFDVINLENFPRLSRCLHIWTQVDTWEKFIFYEPFRDIIEIAEEDILRDNLKVNVNQVIHFECSSKMLEQWLLKIKRFELCTNLEDNEGKLSLRHLPTNSIVSISGESNILWNGILWSENKRFQWDRVIPSQEQECSKLSIVQSKNDKKTIINLIADTFELWKYENVRIKTPFYLGDKGMLNATYYPVLTFEEFTSFQNNFFLRFGKEGVSPIYQNQLYFKRFVQEHPSFAQSLFEKVQHILKTKDTWSHEELPHKELYDAYKIMRNYNTCDRDLFG